MFKAFVIPRSRSSLRRLEQGTMNRLVRANRGNPAILRSRIRASRRYERY